MTDTDDTAALRRRLGREREARKQAEAIAERVTAQLYASQGELKRANAELQALNQSLREFVAVASHDLRNPLTSIIGLSGILAKRWKDLTDERRGEFLDIIDRQGHHLARLVEDLLTVSRIEAGQLDTHAEVVRLSQAIGVVMEDFGHRAAEVRLTVDDAEVLVDPDHFRRILGNFVGNAFRYGAPPVEVDARETGPWVEIRVRDHGCGVPKDLVPRLFEKFARGDDAQEKGGIGLGLSIVQGLARANGGDTWYEANEPQGSCFGLRLPLHAA